jgi:hypothetical protein
MGAGSIAGMAGAMGMGPSWADIFGRVPYGGTGSGMMLKGANGMLGGGV